MKELTSEVLLVRTKSIAAEERRVTLSLIEHLEEIQRRMLYAELGYASLWEFATQELGLSEGAAQRRIQAMRLLRDVPEARAALGNGNLSLSNAARVQSFRQAEKKLGRKVDAVRLVAQVESLSQRECERKLYQLSPEALPRERERIVSAEGERELRIVICAGLHEKLQTLRGLLAHAMPEASYEQLLDFMADEALLRIGKKKGISRDTGSHSDPSSPAIVSLSECGAAATSETGAAPTSALAGTAPPSALSTAPTAVLIGASFEPTAAAAVKAVNSQPALPPGKRVYLPVTMRKAVWARSGGRCEGGIPQRRCSSRYRLEVDHIHPLALGGANEPCNLRLLCWHHNRQQARAKLKSRLSS